jgi:hypothetical protein
MTQDTEDIDYGRGYLNVDYEGSPIEIDVERARKAAMETARYFLSPPAEDQTADEEEEVAARPGSAPLGKIKATEKKGLAKPGTLIDLEQKDGHDDT